MKLTITTYKGQCLVECPFKKGVKIGSKSCTECEYHGSTSTSDYVECETVDDFINVIKKLKYETENSSD